MAGTKRHIDQVLKNKLSNHQAPISEADWDAFAAFQEAKKPKRKLAPYYWGAAVLFVALLSGLLLFTAGPADENVVSSENSTTAPRSTEQTSTSESTPNTSNSEIAELPATELTPTETKVSPEESTASVGETAAPSNDNGTTDSSPNGKSTTEGPAEEKPKANEQNAGQTPSANTNLSEPVQIERYAPLNLTSISPKVLLIPTPSWGWFEPADIMAYTPKEKQDSNKTLFKVGKNTLPMGPCIAVGFVYGFGTPQLNVPESDPSQVHKDYESTQQGTTANTNVFRFFGQYEHRLNIGLEFGAGLQFSSLTQVRSYSFENRNIPYIGVDGEIITYLPVPSGQSVDPTKFVSRQNIYSASVPLSIGYTRNLGSNFRMGIRAQGSFGLNWAKSYQDLDPKTLTETSSQGNSNPFRMGYGGGVYGEYFYLSKWSMRGSLDWTAQNKQYKTANSYNLQNRFYELRFSLVRYL